MQLLVVSGLGMICHLETSWHVDIFGASLGDIETRTSPLWDDKKGSCDLETRLGVGEASFLMG